MSDSSFRLRIKAAVEAREPLDSPEFVGLAESASPDDRHYWRSQVRIDVAVAEWQRLGYAPTITTDRRTRLAAMIVGGAGLKIWRTTSTAKTAAAMAIGVAAVIVWLQGDQPRDDSVAVATVPVAHLSDVGLSEPVVVVEPSTAPVHGIGLVERSVPAIPVVAPIPAEPDRFAQAAVTAERLAYAFQPVGEQVGSVFRLLIDAVPGADVFAM